MRILLKLPTCLTLSELGKELFSRNFRLSLAKGPEKPLVKTRPSLNNLLNSLLD